MRIKLDENLGQQAAARLRGGGHDVLTIVDQDLAGAADRSVIAAAQQEHRCLVTLDLDFGNPILFSPAEYSGIAVLRLPPRATLDDVLARIDTLVRGLSDSTVSGKLWIVDRDRIREYQPDQ